MTLRIRNAGSEPIFTTGLVDASKTLLTGLSNVYLRIMRQSDDYYLDFGDMTFKASPGTPTVAMAEVDATNLPGLYRYVFDLSSVTNETQNDEYVFRVTCASAENAPQEGQINTDDLAAKSGRGDYVFTATAEDSDTDPILGATVQIRDSTGAVLVAKDITDASGEAVFLLDAGSYKVYVYGQGYAWSNPYSLVISGDASATYTGTGDGTSPVTPPDSPDVCRVYGYFKDLGGIPIEGVKVRAELTSRSAWVAGASSGTLLAKTHASTVSDSNGYWYLDLIPNESLGVEPDNAIGEPSDEVDTTYRFTFEAPGFGKKHRDVTVPDETTADFKGLV